MIQRNLTPVLQRFATWYPVVVVTGPRQSGKTTLCRIAFPDKPYVSLEAPDMREFARSDPRGFLAEYAQGAIIDEVQTVPELLSYLQGEVDQEPQAGRFILTGSQHFGLSQSVAQSLAGRAGMLTLLPPSYDELQRFNAYPQDMFDALWQGAYPRIYDRDIPPQRWLADYVANYVERDVRQVLQVGDLAVFGNFLKLCAGRTAQPINLSNLGSDAGISHNTARAWLSVLEASYIVQRLPAWHAKLTKQVRRTAKLHFMDTGLLCYLLGIREAGQLRHHPLRGAIFESWVVAEVLKARLHQGLRADMFHYREAGGLEVDLLLENGQHLIATEIKSGMTVNKDFFTGLARFAKRFDAIDNRHSLLLRLVYGGDVQQQRSMAKVLPWNLIAKENWGNADG
jgi:predicted AAA+ superfamily ATPase